MTTSALFAITTAVTGTLVAATPAWPSFRGPNASGIAAEAHPPVKISPTQGVLWNVEVPFAASSPTVAGHRVFLTTFANGELQTRAYDTASGNLLWSRGVKPEKLEVYHGTDGSPAASTPALEGNRVVSYFGSFGLICHDLNGRELWRHPLPVAISGGSYGTGTSPIISGDLVVLNRDQDLNSSLLAVSLRTGKTVWETPRPEATGSFGTPIVWKNSGADELVVPGSLRLKGYDLKTGHENWVMAGLTAFSCTTPVTGDGLLYFAAWCPGKSDAPWGTWEAFLEHNDTNKDGQVALEELDAGSRDFMRGLDTDHDGKITESDFKRLKEAASKSQNLLVAVKPGGKGDISESNLAWKFERGLPYVPSPLYYDGRLYLVKDGGMISSFDAKTGKAFYTQERLDAVGSYYSSPVVADGHIYIASLPGKLTVIQTGGDKPEILHQAEFGERIFATPAIVGNRIYLRTQSHLYAFGDAANR
jgi:outer membrane protein assembly factor BamB